MDNIKEAEKTGYEPLTEGWNLDFGWSTHLPMLIKTVLHSDKPVIEFGAGIYSTPILHWLCEERGIELITYENDPICYNFCKDYASKNHKVIFIKDWDEIPLDKQYGVVLIDHVPLKRRGVDAIKFKDNADYIVLHDTGIPRKFGYHKVWEHFKYRHDWKKFHPFTSVVSNKNLDFLK